jgi:hypothetical protein
MINMLSVFENELYINALEKELENSNKKIDKYQILCNNNPSTKNTKKFDNDLKLNKILKKIC